jgi:ABC-type uncharacterized transport system ATPase subunit
MPLFEISPIPQSFGEALGVRDVGCAIQRGENLRWLGPNGAGKTTPIWGILKPTKPVRAAQARMTLNRIVLWYGLLSPANRGGYVPCSELALWAVLLNATIFPDFDGECMERRSQ